MRSEKFLQQILSPVFHTHRTKEIFHVNPTIQPKREEAKEIVISVFAYNETEVKQYELKNINECFAFKKSGNTTWINIDGLRKADIEIIAGQFKIHPLLVEDILSIGQ